MKFRGYNFYRGLFIWIPAMLVFYGLVFFCFNSWAYEKLVSDGAIMWVHEPGVVYYNGNTYFGSITFDGDINIGRYNHSSKTVSTYTLFPSLEIDDHDMPTIYIRQDSKIEVFFCRRGGTTLYYMISTNAEDISSWEPIHTISLSRVVYPNPIRLSGENKLWVIFKTTNKWEYIQSTDDGDTFGSPVELFDATPDTTVYLKIISDGVNKIFFSKAGHPNDDGSEMSIYAFYYDSGSFYKSDGTLIESALPLNDSDLTIVYDHTADGNYNSWINDIALLDGEPIITFVTYVDEVGDIRLNYAQLVDDAWTYDEICDLAPLNLSGGVWWTYTNASIDHDNPTIMYVSREIDGIDEIQKAVTLDSGATWTLTNITSGSIVDNIRPLVVKNHAPGFTFLWERGTWTSFTNYDLALYSDAEVTRSIRFEGVNLSGVNVD